MEEKRLIDANELKSVLLSTLEEIKKHPKMDNQEIHIIAATSTVCQMIDDAPTIDPESLRPAGRWRYYDRWSWICSRCAERIYITRVRNREEDKTRYCPYCGARMEGTT